MRPGCSCLRRRSGRQEERLPHSRRAPQSNERDRATHDPGSPRAGTQRWMSIRLNTGQGRQMTMAPSPDQPATERNTVPCLVNHGHFRLPPRKNSEKSGNWSSSHLLAHSSHLLVFSFPLLILSPSRRPVVSSSHLISSTSISSSHLGTSPHHQHVLLLDDRTFASCLMPCSIDAESRWKQRCHCLLPDPQWHVVGQPGVQL